MNNILCGDALDMLKTLPDEMVNCVVTSPPYWGLRDYGTATWEGGDVKCDHRGPQLCSSSSSLAGYSSENIKLRTFTIPMKGTCSKCGAVRIDNQIGLESTPEEYVAKMVEVFREARRVLKNDGTLWLNLGSSYAGSWGNYHPDSPPGKHGQRLKETTRWNRPAYSSQEFLPPTANVTGFKPKDLVPTPWMVAMALQADGWWLRSDIIWSKPNTMPESVTDRPTKSHEYVFLMSKSAKYWYDQEAILEPVSPNTHERLSQNVRGQVGSSRANGGAKSNGNMKAVARKMASAGSGIKNNTSFDSAMAIMPVLRNVRTVWNIATAPFSEAHFATFPPELAERCIKAGCPEGGVVMDPFIGAGTVGMVAKKLMRNYIGIELNPEYVAMAERRIEKECGGLF